MRNANVKLKDGREYCSPLWEWKPNEGWFSLVGEELIVVQLAEVETATEMQWQYAAVGYELVDLVEKAKTQGWTP
jgi:hypothetical protein